MDELLASVTAQLAAAPFGTLGDWEQAIASFALACGGWAAHLLSVNPQGGTPMSIVGGADPGGAQEFEARGGARLEVNPRAAAILRSAPGTLVCEDDFLTPDRLRGSAFYQEFYLRQDVPFSISSTEPQSRGARRMFSIMRGAGQGLAGPQDKRTFSALAPHLWSALALRDQIEDAAIQGALWSCEATGARVVLLDTSLRVAGASPRGEAWLRKSGLARLRGGVLALTCPAAQRQLAAAVAEACSARTWRSPPEALVVLHHENVRASLTVRAFPPSSLAIVSEPRALVVIETASAPRSLGPLTPAETEVLALVLRGLDTDQIAHERQVSRETVRQQLKALYAKFDVGGRAELIALHSVSAPD